MKLDLLSENLSGIDDLPLYAVWFFDSQTMMKLNIPPVENPIHSNELWTFAVLDRHRELECEKRYFISTNGRVYDSVLKKVSYQSDSYQTSKGHYKSVSLIVGKKHATYFVHRLVALAFIPEIEGKPFVNHIDGIPYHNWLWNLEWVNTSENYIHALRTGLKVDARGENRSNALWTDSEIHMICKMMEDGHKATYIYKILGDLMKDPKIEYERVRTLVKHIKQQTHWTHISNQYNIDFTKFNYSKEEKSVQQAIERNAKLKLGELKPS